MKAKYYYMCFKSCDTTEKLEDSIEKCMLDFVKDAENLITTRCAKSREAIASRIKEVNQKWLALIRIHDESKGKLDYDHPLKDVGFNEDGFKASFVHIHPEYSWAFDLDGFKKKIDQAQKEREEALKNFYPYVVKPFEQLTKENLREEFLGIVMALGSYHRVGMPIETLRPLAERAEMIRKWIENDCTINQDDIKAFNERWHRKNAESC